MSRDFLTGLFCGILLTITVAGSFIMGGSIAADYILNSPPHQTKLKVY